MNNTPRKSKTFKITINDIFQDYNDPRKEQLIKRVTLIL